MTSFYRHIFWGSLSLISLTLVDASAQEAEPARADEAGTAAVQEAATPATESASKGSADAKKQPEAYDLSALPDDLRKKVEDYLKQQSELEKEIERLDSMAQASSNPWARQRATGMATKLNYELKNMRLMRKEIIRDYRELLRSGWTPPESMGDFESLFFRETGASS